MLSIVSILCGPGMMGAGKGGKGKGKFSVADMLKGNYTVEVSTNGVKQEMQWKGTFAPVNGTNEAPLNQMKKNIVDENTTTFDIVATKQIKLESENATHIKLIVDGEVFLDANIALNEQENVYKYALDNETASLKLVIYNGLYSVISIIDKTNKDVFEISFTKERVVAKSPTWMKLLQPLALVANFWFSKKMKAKQAAQQAAMQPPVPKEEEEVKEAKDNEGEEKTDKKAEKKEL
ncbi:Conserved_hypothetical protein [Hexamita inflata]|uniref:Uncharacterized protein n=1 Tax=Hexamita inflata TaxID=28002 RepID=A0ABP1J4G2_9EUKA